MKIKCPRCGYKGEVLNNKCLVCELPLESNPSKPFNEKIYKVAILVLVVLVIGFAYLYWNKHSLSKAENEVIKKQFDVKKDNDSKISSTKLEAEQRLPRDQIDKPAVKKDVFISNSSSEADIKNQMNKLAKEIERKRLCISLFQEAHDMANESIRLTDLWLNLQLQEINMMKVSTMNNWPKSVLLEKTQNIKAQMNEMDLKISLLRENRRKNEREIEINNCK